MQTILICQLMKHRPALCFTFCYLISFSCPAALHIGGQFEVYYSCAEKWHKLTHLFIGS